MRESIGRMTDHRPMDPRLRGDDGVFRAPYSKLNCYGISTFSITRGSATWHTLHQRCADVGLRPSTSGGFDSHLIPIFRINTLKNRSNFSCKQWATMLTLALPKLSMLIRHRPMKKKYVMPEIAPENMTPELAELVAFAEQLTKEANAAYEKKTAVEKELARLIKAKQRASRLAK